MPEVWAADARSHLRAVSPRFVTVTRRQASHAGTTAIPPELTDSTYTVNVERGRSRLSEMRGLPYVASTALSLGRGLCILTASCVRENAGMLLQTRRLVNKDGHLTAYHL